MKTIIIAVAAAAFVPACRGEAVDQNQAAKPVEQAAPGAPAADPWKPDPWKPEGRAAPLTDTEPPSAAAPSTAVEPKDTTAAAGVDKSGVVTNTDPQDSETDVTYVEIRTHFSDHARERLARIDARLRDLEARADTRSKAAIQDLRTRRDAVASEMDKIGGQTKDAWSKFRSRVQTSVEDMERDLDAALR